MMVVTIGTVLLLVLLVGSVFLQVHLSKSASRWPGLVLPGIFLVLSLANILNYAVMPGESGAMVAGKLVVVVLLGNIPTLIYLGIYAAGRKKMRMKSELDKMGAQDLE